MTDNHNPHQPTANGQPRQIEIPPVQVSYNIVIGPDGKPWVKLNTQYGWSGHVLVITADVASELAAIYPQVLTGAVTEVRRAASGLIVPNGNAQAPFKLPPDMLR